NRNQFPNLARIKRVMRSVGNSRGSPAGFRGKTFLRPKPQSGEWTGYDKRPSNTAGCTLGPIQPLSGISTSNLTGDRVQNRQAVSRSVRLTLLEVLLGLSHVVGHVGEAQHPSLIRLSEGIEGGRFHFDGKDA